MHRLDVVKLIIEAQPKLLMKQNNTGDSVLHVAADKENFDVIKLLLEKEPKLLDVQNNQGLAAIHRSAQSCKFNVIKLLIKLGADVDILSSFKIHYHNYLVQAAIKSKNFDGLLDFVDFLISRNDGSFNVNYQYTGGAIFVDFVVKYAKDFDVEINSVMPIIQKLRNVGSVEPMSIIGDMRLDLSNGRLDSYEPNQENALKVLNKLYEKYPLSEDEIDEIIEGFDARINAVFSEWVNKEWSDDEMTIMDVVCELIVMNDVYDRLDEGWDFQITLACVIKATKDDEMLELALINCLSELKMCNLGKLMNLLYVVQDKLFEVPELSEQHKGEFFGLALETIKADKYFQEHPEYLDSSIHAWVIAHMEQLPPEAWRPGVTKIQGIMNQVFSTFQVDVAREGSADYINLKDNIIKIDLVETIFRTEAANLPEWKELLNSSVGKKIEALVDKIIQVPDQMQALLENISVRSDLVYANFSTIKVSLFDSCYREIKENLGAEKAAQFAKLLNDEAVLSEEATNHLDAAVKQDLLLIANAQNEQVEDSQVIGDAEVH